jgi:hypothetical protein
MLNNSLHEISMIIVRLKELITRLLLHNYNLPITRWGHAVLYVADLIQL